MTEKKREVANPWRAGCGKSRMPGSEGGVEKHSSAVRSAPTCSESRTSARVLDNSARFRLGFTENETTLLLIVPENQLTIIEKSLQTSGSAHIA
jgi:hypothetical protein